MTLIAELLIAASVTLSQSQTLTLNSHGQDLMATGQYTAAVATFEQALAAAERWFGPRDPATAMVVRNLAVACVQTGNHQRAAVLAQRSVSILESRFGRNDINLVPALNVLGESLLYQRRLAEARDVLARAVLIGAGAGPHYATALQNLGAVLQLQGDRPAAKLYYSQAASERERVLGPDHPYTKASRASRDALDVDLIAVAHR